MNRVKLTLITAICIATAFTFLACEEKGKGAEAAAKAVAEKKASEPAEKPQKIQYGSPLTYEGQTYKTVIIGSQTWMAENLNYKTGNSWCSDNNEANCKKYGRLYDWKTAVKACPSGWHLPKMAEWNKLMAVAGGVRKTNEFGASYYDAAGNKLKSKPGMGWKNEDDIGSEGTDDFGFSALPSGGREIDGSYLPIGFHGSWWSATEREPGTPYGLGINYDASTVNELIGNKGNGWSVRCVKD